MSWVQQVHNAAVVARSLGCLVATGPITFSDISFGMCWCLMSWVQQVHNAAVVARSESQALRVGPRVST